MELVGLMLLLLLSFPAVGRTDYDDCRSSLKTHVRVEGKEAAATLGAGHEAHRQEDRGER